MPNNKVMRGYAELVPNDFMREQFERSVERAGRIGLHLVHIFYRDTISGEMDCRKAYFDGYADAEAYSYEYDNTHKGNKQSYLIFINCNLYVGRFGGEDAAVFMGNIPQEKLEKFFSEKI